MIKIRSVLLFLTVALLQEVFAAPRAKTVMLPVHPLAVAAETKAEMARYSLKAYGNRDATNVVKGLLFTPKPAVSALNAEDDCIGEFVRFVESSTGLFSTNALAFKENVCSRRDEILSGIDYNPRIASILGLAELQILKRMADDVTGWNIAQMKVFTEMSLESLSAAGSDVDAKQAIFCFADIRRSIKSRIISGYEFSRNINPPSQDGTAIAEFSKKKRKDREQRALMDVDEDFGLALAVNARRYVANLHDASERDDFVGKLSDRCLLPDREMTAILTGDFGNLRK